MVERTRNFELSAKTKPGWEAVVKAINANFKDWKIVEVGVKKKDGKDVGYIKMKDS